MSNDKAKSFFSDWQVHVMCLALVIVAELMGNFAYAQGIIRFTLFPMLYVLIIGMILGGVKLISTKNMEIASPYIGISVMFLTAKVASTIGPNFPAVVSAGLPLILQEFGNLFTIFFALPVAVFIFKMGREAVGAAFSTSREGSLAIVGSLYGLDSAEGRGVMGAYITGTLFGTIFNSILASLMLGIGFHPYALGMAAGTGSASMMSAALAPVVEFAAENSHLYNPDIVSAYAATSQVLTSFDGMYMSLFIAIPVTNFLYKVFKGQERHEANEAKKAEKRAAKLNK